MGQTTLSVINTQFKYIQDKAQSLLPENAVIMKLCPAITEATKEGRTYLVPVQLAHENGVTYGDGSVFALNNASSAVYSEISVDATPVILLTQISESVANRMANSKQTFITEASLRAKVMYDSLARYLEISMLYGRSQAGIGAALSTSNLTSTTATITLTAASWAPGVWSGAIGMATDWYYSSSTKMTANLPFTVTKVVNSTRTITVSGHATDITSLASNYGTAYALPYGAYTNDMLGLDAQITGIPAGSSTVQTVFGIDGSVYPLWAGQSYDCGSAALSMAKVLAGVAQAVAVGGLNSNVALFVSAKTYANLDSDLAALRMYDRSYKSTEAENGTKEITYVGSNGPIEVHVNNICKEGEAFAIPVQHIKRVGAKELSFQRPGKKDEFFQEIPNYAGYSLRAGAEFAILLERPAQAVKFINIVNS